MLPIHRIASYLFFMGSVAVNYPTEADGVSIDKVYDPYVEMHEKEVELRSVFYKYDNQARNFASHKLGIGYAPTENFFAEIYLISESEPENAFRNDGDDIKAYELEAKWQLTEQGEYAMDWGLLFEYEKYRDFDENEFSTSLLNAIEFGQWVTTSNASVIFEWLSDDTREVEFAFNQQWRYRYQRAFEFGAELYFSQDTRAIGPVAMGSIKFSGRKKMQWELGALRGLESGENAITPKLSIRALLEIEF